MDVSQMDVDQRDVS